MLLNGQIKKRSLNCLRVPKSITLVTASVCVVAAKWAKIDRDILSEIEKEFELSKSR